MVDYIRHILNMFKGKEYTEEQVEAAIYKVENEGEAEALRYLVQNRMMNEDAAIELITGIRNELKKLKRESAIRSFIWIIFFSVVGVLAWMAHGYWLGGICLAIALYNLVVTLRYFFSKK